MLVIIKQQYIFKSYERKSHTIKVPISSKYIEFYIRTKRPIMQ